MNPEPDPDSPFAKDVLEERKQPLSEKDFIQEPSGKPPLLGSFPLWLWLALLSIAISLILGGLGWFQDHLKKETASKPFLEVTNREFSLFLWQYPSFMRPYVKQKTGYLPGFDYTNGNLKPQSAEEIVVAPPDLLFLYHTWKRLLAAEFIVRPIPASEFTEFLSQIEEWQPKYWPQAPEAYKNLIESHAYEKEENLQTLSESTLPLTVRQAFQGWKNYFKEGPSINQLNPSFAQITKFLQQHPHYARSYWRNIKHIFDQDIAGLNYLQDLANQPQSDLVVPKDQLAPFLKVTLFNAEQAQKGL